ncbi:hypothetical protein M8J77_011806 [Diaphorina citri]|nr:hypothetical protein M8J77_011806 [Diaphorina citri]
MFADDTTILVTGDTKILAQENLNIVLHRIQSWFSRNKLKLNSNKTTYMYFNPHAPGSMNPIISGDLTVSYSQEIKFLGVVVDEKLKWKSHVEYIKGKLSSSIFAISSVKKNVGPDPALLTYFAYFHSVMIYGIVYWGFSSCSSDVFLLQKRALRSVFGLRRDVSCRSIFKDNKILTFWGQLALDTCVLLHKTQDSLKKHSSVHDHNTRGRDSLVPSRENLFFKSYLSAGIRIYNLLPLHLKQMQNNDSFKTALKEYILDVSPYDLQELSVSLV